MSDLLTIRELHLKYVSTIVAFGTLLHLIQLDADLFIYLVIPLYYIALVGSNIAIRLLFRYNTKILRILLNLLMIFYTYIAIELLISCNLDMVKASMIMISVTLLLQALSINLDYIILRNIHITLLDLYILSSLLFAFLYTATNYYKVSLHKVAIMVLMSILGIYLGFINKPLLPIITPLALYVLNFYKLNLLIAFISLAFIAYLCGYTKSINRTPALALFYDIGSVFIFMLILILLLLIRISNPYSLFIIQIVYYVVLLTMGLYSIIKFNDINN